jgi:hypothetical protein
MRKREHKIKYQPLKTNHWRHVHSGRGHPQTNIQDNRNKNVNNPQRERESISYMSNVVLLKMYLRFSTGSQE